MLGVAIAVGVRFLRPHGSGGYEWTLAIGIVVDLFLLWSMYRQIRKFQNSKIILNDREIIGIDSTGRVYASAAVTAIRGREYSAREEYEILLDTGVIDVERNIRDFRGLTAAIKQHEIANNGSDETTRELHDNRMRHQRKKGAVLLALGCALIVVGFVALVSSNVDLGSMFSTIACLSFAAGALIALGGGAALADADLDV